jgi:hypothetical protein
VGHMVEAPTTGAIRITDLVPETILRHHSTERKIDK